ncbi:MAG: cold-shock protein [Peptococcales bacterium]
MKEEIKTGTVKVIFERGFGFIVDENNEDVFFHVTGCVEPKFNDLKKGMKVNYTEEEKDGKIRAINIVEI